MNCACQRKKTVFCLNRPKAESNAILLKERLEIEMPNKLTILEKKAALTNDQGITEFELRIKNAENNVLLQAKKLEYDRIQNQLELQNMLEKAKLEQQAVIQIRDIKNIYPVVQYGKIRKTSNVCHLLPWKKICIIFSKDFQTR